MRVEILARRGVSVISEYVAVVLLAASIVTWHVPVPVHAPLHPTKVDPAAGVELSVTDVAASKLDEQVAPHVMAAGDEITVPAPVPVFVTVSRYEVTGPTLNVAVTLLAASIVTWQAPVPVHPPLHPANRDPPIGAAASVTDVPKLKFATHVAPQLMPVGEEVTAPDPLPDFEMFSANAIAGAKLKVAVTLFAASRVTKHDPLPEHPPDHPPNVEPADGVAVNTRDVPDEKFAEHTPPQLIPVGALSKVPLPRPVFATVKVKAGTCVVALLDGTERGPGPAAFVAATVHA
jgi:hypothetical protein